MKTVDSPLEPFTHLDLVDHDDIPATLDIVLFHICMQRMVFRQRLELK